MDNYFFLNLNSLPIKLSIFICGLSLLLISCQEKNKTANFYSFNIPKSERLEKFENYIVNHGGITDMKYHIWHQDNSTGMMAAPSDWRYTIALQLQPDSIPQWLTDVELTTDSIPIDLWNSLQLNRIDWQLQAPYETYMSVNQQRIKLLFREENILLCLHSTMSIQ